MRKLIYRYLGKFIANWSGGYTKETPKRYIFITSLFFPEYRRPKGKSLNKLHKEHEKTHLKRMKHNGN